MSYAQTKLIDGPSRLIRIAEDLRARNTDGYLSGVGGLLAKVKRSAVPFNHATVCSPFSGTVIALALDPKYPRDDLPEKEGGKGDAYVPMFNGGTDELPFDKWYNVHNGNDGGVPSIVNYNLGFELDDIRKMRRGDLLGINWFHGGGHSCFCWDVHVDAKGQVDAFQMLGSHGNSPGWGVYIYGCNTEQWIKGGLPSAGKLGSGSLKKAKDKIFVDEDAIVQWGWWFGMPGVKKVDLSTFRVRPKRIISYAETPGMLCLWGPSEKNTLKVARLWYDGDPPAPYCMKDGSSPADPSPPGHIDAPVTTIKANDIKKDPGAAAKVRPKPAQQDAKKPLNLQHDVETAMQDFFRAKWITSDPGDSDHINDAKSQAAIKEFQKLFKLEVDGIVGKHTKAALKDQVPACHEQHTSEVLLGALFRGGKIKSDPGTPTGMVNDKLRAAIKEFQKANGLVDNGVPDAATLTKLKKAVEESAPSANQHGLEPTPVVLYWLGNEVEPGGTATLRLVTVDVKVGQEFQIFLKDVAGKEVEASVKMLAAAKQTEAAVPIPANFGEGAMVWARVKATIDGGKTLELPGPAPLFVRKKVAPVAGGDLQKFFSFSGNVGEGSRKRDYTYVSWKVPGKPNAWLIKGRLLMDTDGAPNCYHPQDLNVRTDYQNYDLMAHKGALDWKANGGHPGNWFGVVTDTGEVTGTPLVQGNSDPFPGFYVSSSSLVDKSKKRGDPTRYVDARKVPYLAWPQQIWLEKGPRFTRVSQGATGRIGDLMTAYNPKNGKVGHLILADMGGYDDPHFGEGSPALGKLIDAYGHQEPDILYIVYPHSGADQGTIPSPEDIQQKGQKLFEEWGGVAEVQRVLPMMDSRGSAGKAPAQPVPDKAAGGGGPVADPIGDPKCDRCSALQKLLDAGVDQKIKHNGSDKSSIMLLQYHLVQFGYSMGTAGPAKDGVDGDFGATTAKQLGAFLKEAGKPGDSDALSADAARLVLEKHKAGFKTAGTPKPKPQPEAGEMHWGIDYAIGDENEKADWDKAKNEAKLSFVFVKAAQGPWTYTSWYKKHFGAAGDAGVTRGAYLFLDYFKKNQQTRLEEPEAQVKNFIEAAGDFAKTDFPPTIDVEDSVAKSGLGAKRYIEWTRRAWKALFDHYGAAPIIYTASHLWGDSDELNGARADDLVESPLWLAKPYLFNKQQPARLDPALFAGGKNAPSKYLDGYRGQHWPPEVPASWGGTADPDNWWIHQYHGDAWQFPGFKQVDVNRFNSMVKGATGARVKWVQRRLGIDETGTYDDAAVEKVKALQGNQGIDPADGIIGPRTFALLCWMNPKR